MFDPDAYRWDLDDSLGWTDAGMVLPRPTRDSRWYAPRTYPYVLTEDTGREEADGGELLAVEVELPR